MTLLKKIWAKIRRRISKKIAAHLPALGYALGNGSYAFRPTLIRIGVNDVCNAFCPMCDRGLKNSMKSALDDDILSLKTLEKLIKEVKKYKPEIIILAAEPLLYPDIIQAVEIIKKNDLRLTLLTNGILLEKYADDLVRSGIDALTVSLDGIGEQHDNIRGKGVFEKAVAGIRKVRQIKKDLNKPIPSMHINYTISNLNYGGLLEFADKMINNEKVDSIRFSHLNFETGEQNILKDIFPNHINNYEPVKNADPVIIPSQVDIDVLWEQIQAVKKFSDFIGFTPELKDKTALYNYYNHPEIPVTNKKCLHPWEGLTLMPNGDLSIRGRCFRNYVVGNINNNSFDEIWHGEKCKNFRITLKKHGGTFPVCSRCCRIL